MFLDFSLVCNNFKHLLYHSGLLTLQHYRYRREYLLSRNAVYHRLLVPERWVGKTVMHISHEQRNCQYVFWLSDGRGFPPRRTRRLQGLAMVRNWQSLGIGSYTNYHQGFLLSTGSFPCPWLLVDSLSFPMCLRSPIHGIWVKRQVCFQTFAFDTGIDIKVGGHSRSNANEIRRKTEQTAIHKVKAEENLYVVAHLSSDIALHVSWILESI